MSPAQRLSAAATVVSDGSVWTSRVVARVWRFWMALVVDKYHGLSLNRFLSIGFGLAAVHGRFFDDKPLTWLDLSFAVVAGSLSFGKDIWLAYVQRTQQEHEDHEDGK